MTCCLKVTITHMTIAGTFNVVRLCHVAVSYSQNENNSSTNNTPYVTPLKPHDIKIRLQ